MTLETLNHRLVARYLKVLAVPERLPSRAALEELIAAHLKRIPFENLSKLLHRKRIGLIGMPPIELFLEGVERWHLGGTCYANNFHLYSLLASLGYDVKLCGADMLQPDVHLVVMVRLDGRDYLADVGYAAPFLRPFPLDAEEDQIVALGDERYVLKPRDALGRSRLELYRAARLTHGYVAKAVPRAIEEFQQVIADSFRPGATFLNAVLLARFFSNHSVVIHNLTLVQSRGTHTQTKALTNRDVLCAAIERKFEIPRALAAEALGEIGELHDVRG